MKKILSIIGKILLAFLAFFIFSFLVFWYKIYNENQYNRKGIYRITDSFAGTLFWFLMGLLITFKGDVGPFNFFLSIYGIDTKDFKTIKPGPLGSNFENKTIIN